MTILSKYGCPASNGGWKFCWWASVELLPVSDASEGSFLLCQFVAEKLADFELLGINYLSVWQNVTFFVIKWVGSCPSLLGATG